MKNPIDLRTLAGGAALVAMLLLSSPGVRAERSADAEAAAPTCNSPKLAETAPELEAFLANVRSQEAAQNANRSDASGYVVLNNAGYNYQTYRNAVAASEEAKADEAL